MKSPQEFKTLGQVQPGIRKLKSQIAALDETIQKERGKLGGITLARASIAHAISMLDYIVRNKQDARGYAEIKTRAAKARCRRAGKGPGGGREGRDGAASWRAREGR